MSKYFLLAAVQLLYIDDTLSIYLLKCSLNTVVLTPMKVVKLLEKNMVNRMNRINCIFSWFNFKNPIIVT